MQYKVAGLVPLHIVSSNTMFGQECGGVKVVFTSRVNGNTMVMEMVFILTNVVLSKPIELPSRISKCVIFWYYNLLLYQIELTFWTLTLQYANHNFG